MAESSVHLLPAKAAAAAINSISHRTAIKIVKLNGQRGMVAGFATSSVQRAVLRAVCGRWAVIHEARKPPGVMNERREKLKKKEGRV